MTKPHSDIIVRLPSNAKGWISIDKLKTLRVEVVNQTQRAKLGRMSLDDLLHKMR